MDCRETPNLGIAQFVFCIARRKREGEGSVKAMTKDGVKDDWVVADDWELGQDGDWVKPSELAWLEDGPIVPELKLGGGIAVRALNRIADALFHDRSRELATMPYREYLQTPEWQARRLRALERAGHRCQVCNDGKQLNVHHRTYERRGNERDEDLFTLCRGCHSIFHREGKLAK